MNRRRRTPAVLGLVAVLVAGCASLGREPAPLAPPGFIQELILPAEGVGTVQGLVNYNLYAPNALTSTWLYEPLMIRDQFSCDLVPWLATGYQWPDQQTLVLTIRDGVTWSDGQPFTAADVAFTFNAGKAYPAADKAGLWGELFGAPAVSVEAVDNTVVFHFSGPAASKLDGIASTRIVPEHVYGAVGDITQYIDTSPVGTGPFLVGAYNGRRLVLTRNENYWQADKVKVAQLSLEGQYDANSAALKLRNGDLDIYTGDIPNPAKSVAGSGKTGFYYSPAGTTVLAPNNQRFPFDDPAFRVAMASAIDKGQLTRKASFGVMDVGSQTMLKLPVQAADVPAAYAADGGIIPYDPAKAAAEFDAAGYRMGPDGRRTGPNGEPISIVFSVQAGFVDYLAMADVVVRNMAALGFDIKLIATDPNAVDAQKKSGDFDLVIDYVNGGCVRAKDFGGKLATNQISTEKDLLLNVARYSDPATDALIARYDATVDPAEQNAYDDQLIDIFMTKMPYIALQYAPQRFIYRNGAASGWPSPENPYPTDSLLYVITHLSPPQ